MYLEYLLLLLLLQHFKTGQGQRAIVSISPVTELTPGTSVLTVTCTPSGSGVTQYEGITLYHNDSQSTMTETQVATVYYSQATANNVVVLSSPYKTRLEVNATGAVTPLGSAQLRVTFDATSTLCGDAGTYRCEVKGKDTNNADIIWGGMTSISANGKCIKNNTVLAVATVVPSCVLIAVIALWFKESRKRHKGEITSNSQNMQSSYI